MVEYKCECCNFSSTLKANYTRHLNTKKHKRNKDNHEGLQLALTKKSQKEPEKSQKEPEKSQEISFLCSYCNLPFKTFANKRRHELHRCKNITTKVKNDTSKIELRELKKQRKIMLKQIDQLIKKAGNTTITNNTQNNIKLNGYGKENLSFITDAFKTQLVKGPYGMIPKMIEHIHFNDEIPENKNISLPNKKENIIKIFSGDKWIFKNKNEVLNDLVDGKYFILDTHYENMCNQEDNQPFYKNVYESFKKMFDAQDKQLHEYVRNQCELVLLNNR